MPTTNNKAAKTADVEKINTSGSSTSSTMKRNNHQRSKKSSGLMQCCGAAPCGGGQKLKSALPSKMDPLELEQLASVTRLTQTEVMGLYQTFRKASAPHQEMSMERFRSIMIFSIAVKIFYFDVF